MGKGRKYSIDRLLSTSASTGHLSSHVDLPDLDEADVWSVTEPDHQPITSRRAGGLSLTFDHSTPSINQAHRQPMGRRHVEGSAASSLPVNVPDWNRPQAVRRICNYEEIEREWKEDDVDWVPPHEWAQARGGTTASVFQGVGRTLKGRDLSRVRDAVWSQTGFYG
ncbi:protein S40-5-like [Carex rostrata]